VAKDKGVQMQRLKQELHSIVDNDIRQMTENILKVAPETFWKISASSSGKYHPTQSNGEGGLIQHTKMICSMIPIFVRAYNLNQKEQDKLMSAAILHDVHKHSYTHAIDTWQWMLTSEISSKVCEGLNISREDYAEIANMIKMHMGRWTKVPFLKPIENYTKNEWIIHLADMVVTNQKIKFEWEEHG
jgi:hypothetical protein